MRPRHSRVEPAGRRIPANRNRVLAELAADPACSHFALPEDDHKPIAEGWLARYVEALHVDVVSVVWRLGRVAWPRVWVARWS